MHEGAHTPAMGTAGATAAMGAPRARRHLAVRRPILPPMNPDDGGYDGYGHGGPSRVAAAGKMVLFVVLAMIAIAAGVAFALNATNGSGGGSVAAAHDLELAEDLAVGLPVGQPVDADTPGTSQGQSYGSSRTATASRPRTHRSRSAVADAEQVARLALAGHATRARRPARTRAPTQGTTPAHEGTTSGHDPARPAAPTAGTTSGDHRGPTDGTSHGHHRHVQRPTRARPPGSTREPPTAPAPARHGHRPAAPGAPADPVTEPAHPAKASHTASYSRVHQTARADAAGNCGSARRSCELVAPAQDPEVVEPLPPHPVHGGRQLLGVGPGGPPVGPRVAPVPWPAPARPRGVRRRSRRPGPPPRRAAARRAGPSRRSRRARPSGPRRGTAGSAGGSRRAPRRRWRGPAGRRWACWPSSTRRSRSRCSASSSKASRGPVPAGPRHQVVDEREAVRGIGAEVLGLWHVGLHDLGQAGVHEPEQRAEPAGLHGAELGAVAVAAVRPRGAGRSSGRRSPATVSPSASGTGGATGTPRAWRRSVARCWRAMASRSPSRWCLRK